MAKLSRMGEKNKQISKKNDMPKTRINQEGFIFQMYCGVNLCVLWTASAQTVDRLTMYCGVVFGNL